MRYISTRGNARPVTFDQAVASGQATDGGLFIPISIPQRPVESDRGVATPADLAVRVLPEWIGRAVPPALAEDALSIEIPVVHLGDRSSDFEAIYVVELFHGPTASFKDFGARFLAGWLSMEMPPSNGRRVVLVATSGDTGSAVADAFAGRSDTAVVVLYPLDGVSAYQRLQLTKKREGVFPFAVRGSFDDCQKAVKKAFRDASLSELLLTSANSINIGRLLPQMLFYLWGALQVGTERPLFVVPSGNLGNLCAGLLAARSGIPDARFIAATNRNRYLIDYLADDEAERRPVYHTLSNAMDVAVPSNLERMVHLFGRLELLSLVSGTSVSDRETKKTMRKVWSETGYLADPHTAVGLSAALRNRNTSGRPVFVMGTAHADKYRELVAEIVGAGTEDELTASEPVEETVIDHGLPALREVIANVA